ncbi:MAG TPA: Mov34/MPN/PAD-1 family protein [Candidatus Sulfomarinibacteraceae bacterium]|nr:Mov34/MPN/PAD-1 family protein [Candidatus Sulfomarinibacteraceae bacterium]
MRAATSALPQKAPSAAGAQARLHGQRPGVGETNVLLHPSAIEAIRAHTLSDNSSEVGGVLLGEAYAHHDKVYVEVTAALPVVSDDYGPIHFTFNADAWSQAHRDKASRFPELDIVGWFHTHPGLGVFFSADDVVVHSAAFVMPWHVALVIDPSHAETAVFGWVGGEISPLSGFFELLEETGERQLPWRHVRAEVWDETYEAHLARQRAARSTTRQTVSEDIAPVNPWLGLLVGALGVFLSLALLAGGVLPLYRHNNALESVVVALASEQLAEATAAGTASCPDPALRLYSPLPGATADLTRPVAVVGTASHAEATRYEIAVRPAGEESWWPLHTSRRDVTTGQLMEWDATQFAEGPYQLRLSALGPGQQPLSDPAPCIIDFALVRN